MTREQLETRRRARRYEAWITVLVRGAHEELTCFTNHLAYAKRWMRAQITAFPESEHYAIDDRFEHERVWPPEVTE